MQHDGAALILAHDVESILANIDTITAIAALSIFDMARSLSLAPLARHRLLAGQEARPDRFISGQNEQRFKEEVEHAILNIRKGLPKISSSNSRPSSFNTSIVA